MPCGAMAKDEAVEGEEQERSHGVQGFATKVPGRYSTSSITVPADCLIKNEIRSETRVHPEFDKMTYANPD